MTVNHPVFSSMHGQARFVNECDAAAGPSAAPREPGDAIEVEHTVNATGSVSLARRQVLAAEILGGSA